MIIRGHLCIEPITLPPTAEWTDAAPGWRFLRVSQGAAYWLSPDLTRDLAVGEVVVAAPGAKGTIRASQLGEVRAHGFHFSPDRVCGIFSLSERHFFDTLAVQTKEPVRFLPPTHPVSQQFAVLTAPDPGCPSLVQRCGLLNLLATLFAEDLKLQRTPPAPASSALKRFNHLIAQVSDQEIVNYKPRQLAELCGCSLRHFTRLFHDHFGTSPRSKQIELRLLKARQLLGATDDKIIHIAIDSGFRNLGLFNALFKRQVGMTPSEWREKQTKGSGKVSRAAVVILAGLALAAAWLAPSQAARAAVENAPPVGPLAVVTNDPGRFARPPQSSQENAESAADRLLRIEREVEVWRRSQKDTNTPAAVTPPAANPVAASTNAPSSVAASPARRPSASTNAGPVFEVRGYDIQGNTLLPANLIEPMLAKYTGPAVSFETIHAAQTDMQMAYRDRGFISVAVALPKQTLTNGLVKMQVTEGRLADINVVNNRHFSTRNVLRALPSLRTNMFLNSLVFQQELDRANASRDRQIYPVLGPGPEPGTTSLNLRVKDRLPWHGRLELNNNATPNTPELRFNMASQYNNLWQREHQFGAQYSFTPEDLKQTDQGGRFYDQPLIANYSAFYRMPLSPINGAPLTREYAVSDFGYDEVTKRFRPPPARDASELLIYASRSVSDTGLLSQGTTRTPDKDFQNLPPSSDPGGLQVLETLSSQTLTVNEDLGLRFLQPLAGPGKIHSSLAMGLDFKKYQSAMIQKEDFKATLFVPEYGTNGPPFTEFNSPTNGSMRSLNSEVNYLPFQINWDASVADKYGSTSFNINNSFQFTGLINNKRDFESVAGSTNTDGNYYVLNVGVTRDQKISGEWGLRLHADGQWANQPLISNEQFGLGGAAGVRGYRDGEEYGDTGWRAQFEPYTPYLDLGLVDNAVPMYVRLSAFVDCGQRFLLDPGPRQADVTMLGAGAALTGSIGEHVDFRFCVGFPLLDAPNWPAGSVRVLFGFGMQF